MIVPKTMSIKIQITIKLFGLQATSSGMLKHAHAAPSQLLYLLITHLHLLRVLLTTYGMTGLVFGIVHHSLLQIIVKPVIILTQAHVSANVHQVPARTALLGILYNVYAHAMPKLSNANATSTLIKSAAHVNVILNKWPRKTVI